MLNKLMIKTAIILAGGKGERLRPYTDKLPKPMIPVLGKPLMEYQVIWLKHQGIKYIVFCCGYKYEAIQDYFGDGSKWEMKFDYAIEETPLGRGGAFKNALKFIPEDEKMVVGANGDELIGEELDKMVDEHVKNRAAATLLLVKLRSPFGIVDLSKDNRITNFKEKPELPYWISVGVYVLNRSAIKLFPDVGDHEDTTFPDLVRENKLFGYKAKAIWTTINTVKDLNEAKKTLPKNLPKYMLQKDIKYLTK